MNFQEKVVTLQTNCENGLHRPCSVILKRVTRKGVLNCT